MEGRPVRLAGQDSRRGTFVQRFATIIDRNNADEWTPLSNLTEDQAPFHVYDSLLSEYAALGFEYGYSVARPDALVCWEAQFGDFVNGAQIVTDEYITAGQTKWGQQSGVVLLLPHGYEGQGPDHSSARIERFLTMAADNAFVVAQPSTPASHFHLLRRHALGEEHKPLIIFTPKSMLKRKEAASQPGGLHPGRRSHRSPGTPPRTRRRSPRCCCAAGGSPGTSWSSAASGRARTRPPRSSGVEQLYPRPVAELQAELARFPNLGEVRWVQDEPANMGPAPHFQLNVFDQLGRAGPGGRPAGVLLAGGRPALPPRRGAEGTARAGLRLSRAPDEMYFTDRGLEELEKRRGEEEVTLAWLADQLQAFVDVHPEFETAVERFATWLARADDPDED